jgi:hypothetical protein
MGKENRPRNATDGGEIWTDLVLRLSVLAGVTQVVFYSFSGSASWGKEHTLERDLIW